MSHAITNRSALLARVRRIAGQMAGIERAVEGEPDCASVLQQVAAVRGAVNGLLGEIIEGHLAEHVARPDLSEAERAAGSEELLAVIRRYMK